MSGSSRRSQPFTDGRARSYFAPGKIFHGLDVRLLSMQRKGRTFMIRRALIAAVLVFPFTLMAQTTGDPFSVNLPAGFSPFTKSSQVMDSKDGKIATTNWVAKSPDGQAVVVSVSKMPGKILDPAKLVNSTRDGLVKSLHATMDSEQTTADTPPATGLLLHSDAAWVRA